MSLRDFPPVAADHTTALVAPRVGKLALDLVSGAGIYKTHELRRLLRELTLGPVHPASAGLVHEIVGKTALGLLGQTPRWG